MFEAQNELLFFSSISLKAIEFLMIVGLKN
jgi:hypothetical protein